MFLNFKHIQTFSREGLWIALGQILAVIGSLLGVRILTGLLEPAAYGELALGLTAVTLINQVLMGPLSSGAARFYSTALEKNDLNGYLKAVKKLLFSVSWIIVSFIIVVSIILWILGEKEWIAIAISALIFSILSGYNSTFNSIQNAARQRFVVAFHQGLEPWMRFIFAALLIIWGGADSTAAMIGYSVAVLLVIVSQFIFFRKIFHLDQKVRVDIIDWSIKIWNFSWPISVWGVFTWMQLVSDRWALKFFSTTEEVGLYAVLFQIGFFPMMMISGVIEQFLAPIFFQKVGDASDINRNEIINKLSLRLIWLILILIVLIFLATSFLHKEIFNIFVSEEYAAISYLLPWMLLAGGFFSAGQTIALNFLSQLKSHLMIRVKTYTALFGVFFNFMGAFWFGLIGIVGANVLFTSTYFIWMLLIAKGLRKQKSQ